MKFLNDWCYLRVKPWRKSLGWVKRCICKTQAAFFEHHAAGTTAHSVLNLGHGRHLLVLQWLCDLAY